MVITNDDVRLDRRHLEEISEDEGLTVITSTQGGNTIYYDVVGSGPGLIFVHGAGSDADIFAGLIGSLSNRFRCITMDRPGYNRSGHLERATTLEEQVEAIEAVRRACDAKGAWVFGHSSGGNFALAHACSFGSSVRGLILMEPALYGIYPADQKPPAVTGIEQEVVPLFQKGQLVEGFTRLQELLGVSISEKQISVLQDQGMLENFRPFGFDQPVVLNWRPSNEALDGIGQPVLILEGDQTTSLLRDICQLLLPHLPKGELRTLKGCDHFAPVTNPVAVAEEVVRFTENHS